MRGNKDVRFRGAISDFCCLKEQLIMRRRKRDGFQRGNVCVAKK